MSERRRRAHQDVTLSHLLEEGLELLVEVAGEVRTRKRELRPEATDGVHRSFDELRTGMQPEVAARSEVEALALLHDRAPPGAAARRVPYQTIPEELVEMPVDGLHRAGAREMKLTSYGHRRAPFLRRRRGRPVATRDPRPRRGSRWPTGPRSRGAGSS